MPPARPRAAMSRRDVTKLLAAGGAGLLVGGTVHGYTNERHQIGITRASLGVSGLPDAFIGMRVALLTDFHLSPIVDADDIARAVEMTLAEKPDLIILGGDYVTWGHERFIGPVGELLSPLTAPLGVIAILGNHDSDKGGDDVTAALTRNRFTVLRDARTRIEQRGDGLDFIGLRYWTRQPSTIAKLIDAPGHVNILLAHDPRRVTEAAELNLPLVLSGHTHGGQIVLPGLGAWNRGFFPTMQGTLERDNTVLFVSRGIGMVYVPVRLNCPPEIALLTLQRRGVLG
ncbi:MAG TPA: metallophosphoesterase [Vicinamibacterales bacterium]|nr:metallophosphoesterase [Vicinamibacterales bacterium]